MADNTLIEWADSTCNAVNGCSVVSPGCTNCYAMKWAGTRLKHDPSRVGLTTDSKAGPVWTGEVRLNEKALLQPLRWKRPRRIFWNAHGDLFHDAVPDEWIDRVFAVCALTPQHQHLILTKRSARMREYCDRKTSASGAGAVADAMMTMGGSAGKQLAFMDRQAEKSCLPNVWLGVSVEDQARADQRIPDLLATPAAVRFISAEPLLGAVDLTMLHHDGITNIDALRGMHGVLQPMLAECDKLDWVIVGGESGPGARGSCVEVEQWMCDLRDQCAAAGVPFFGKQNFKKFPLPDDLLVREFPNAR